MSSTCLLINDPTGSQDSWLQETLYKNDFFPPKSSLISPIWREGALLRHDVFSVVLHYVLFCSLAFLPGYLASYQIDSVACDMIGNGAICLSPLKLVHVV